eukprot:scaffold35075_cov27-Phaeocystis_antarctica.AAC.1
MLSAPRSPGRATASSDCVGRLRRAAARYVRVDLESHPAMVAAARTTVAAATVTGIGPGSRGDRRW